MATSTQLIQAAEARRKRHDDDPMLREIKEHMARPPGTTIVLTFTPAMAEAVLDKYNIDNRPLKPGKIREFSQDLSVGKWLLTGDTIKFSKLKRLIDGQNRLTACKQSGAALVSHVIFDVPDEAFAVVDTGQSRSQGDVLSIAKIKDGNLIAHIISWAHTLETAPGRRDRLPLSPAQILDLYRTDHRDCAAHLGWGSRLQSAVGLTRARGAVLHYVFMRHGGQERADEFMTAWSEGGAANYRKFPQVEILRRRISELQTNTLHTITARILYASAIKAWNAYVAGRAITMAEIKWGQDEPFPTVARVEGAM